MAACINSDRGKPFAGVGRYVSGLSIKYSLAKGRGNGGCNHHGSCISIIVVCRWCARFYVWSSGLDFILLLFGSGLSDLLGFRKEVQSIDQNSQIRGALDVTNWPGPTKGKQ